MEDRTVKARLETIMSQSKFVDDAALYAVTRQAVERVAVTIFVTIAAGRGLTVSLEKTKMISMGCPKDNLPIQLESAW